MNFLRNISLNGVSFNQLQGDPRQMYGADMFRNYADIQAPQEIRKYAPEIAAATYRYIASKANQNRQRAIHFNMLVAENGSNPELQVLTTFITNLIYIKVKEKAFNDLNTAVNTCVPWAVDRRINFIVINEPSLFNDLQQYASDIKNYASEYVAEAENVFNFMGSTYMGGTVAASFGQPTQQTGFGQPMTGFGGGGGNTIGGFGNSNVISGFGGMSNNTGISSVITRVDNAGNVFKPEEARLGSSMVGLEDLAQANPIKEPKQEPDVAQQTQVQQQKRFNPLDYYTEDGKPNIKVLPVTDRPWTSSIMQPNPVAYDKRMFNGINKLLPSKDGKKEYVIISLEQIVDRSKHALTTSQNFFEGIVTESVKDREQHVNKELIKAVEKVKEVKQIEQENEYNASLSRFRENSHIVLKTPVSSVEDAVAFGRLAAMRFKTEEFGVYNVEFKMEKKFPIKREDMKPLLQVTKSSTFTGLINRLSLLIEDQEMSNSVRTAAVQLNAHIGAKLIDFIRFILSIDEFTRIDSFVDDFNDLMKIIEEDYGEVYKQSLLENQERFIQSYVTFGDFYNENISSETILTDGEIDEDNNYVIASLLTPSIVACTEFLDVELGLKVPEKIGAVFTPKTISENLYKLMESLISKNKSVGLNSKIHCFYFVTIDDCVYEVNKGLSEKSPLLIRRLK